MVVRPCGGGDVDGLVGGAGEEFVEEESAEVDGAGAGDGLEGCYLGDVRRVENTRRGGGVEGGRGKGGEG